MPPSPPPSSPSSSSASSSPPTEGHPLAILPWEITSSPKCLFFSHQEVILGSPSSITSTILITHRYFPILSKKPAQWAICSFAQPGGDTSIMEGMAAGQSHQTDDDWCDKNTTMNVFDRIDTCPPLRLLSSKLDIAALHQGHRTLSHEAKKPQRL